MRVYQWQHSLRRASDTDSHEMRPLRVTVSRRRTCVCVCVLRAGRDLLSAWVWWEYLSTNRTRQNRHSTGLCLHQGRRWCQLWPFTDIWLSVCVLVTRFQTTWCVCFSGSRPLRIPPHPPGFWSFSVAGLQIRQLWRFSPPRWRTLKVPGLSHEYVRLWLYHHGLRVTHATSLFSCAPSLSFLSFLLWVSSLKGSGRDKALSLRVVRRHRPRRRQSRQISE